MKATLKVGHISIGIAITLSLTEAYAIDDRGVVQCVRNDGILIGEERLEYTTISVEAGSVEDCVLGLEVVRDGSLEFLVKVLCAANEAYR